MPEQVAVTIRILDKEFQIGCPQEERKALEDSARYLNEQMREVKNSGVVGTERIAILAALNITRELLNNKTSSNNVNDLNTGISQLSQHLSEVLTQLQPNSSN